MSTGANGDVYLALKIGPDGKVIDGVVEQENLTTKGTETQMIEARRILGSESLALIRTWTFAVPTRGKEAGKPYWSGLLPYRSGSSANPSPMAGGKGISRVRARASPGARKKGIDRKAEPAIPMRHPKANFRWMEPGPSSLLH